MAENETNEGFWENIFWGYFGRGGAGPELIGPPKPSEEEQEKSRYIRSVEEATHVDLEEMADDPELQKEELKRQLVAEGVDITNAIVAQAIENLPADMDAAMISAMVLAYSRNPEFRSAPFTAYDETLAMSGFSNVPFYPHGAPGVARSFAQTHAEEGVHKRGVYKPPRYEIHPDTGWIRYRNGVLVNPDPFNAQVSYEPNSTAPGAPLYMREVPNWGDEKKKEWRSTLVEKGYLSKEDKSEEGFLNALQSYHVAYYLNWGKAPSREGAPTGGGPLEGQVTAKDFQAQIRNDVRDQYRRIYGAEPTSRELEQWARFITQRSLEIQRQLVRRGVSPGEAAAAAGGEAEEMFVDRLENEPGAVYLRESYEENTELRDALDDASRVWSLLS